MHRVISFALGIVTLLLVVFVGSSPARAGTISLDLTNSGINSFLSPFPEINIHGDSTQPVIGPAVVGQFSYDFTIHVLTANGGGSLATGLINFDFGGAGKFMGLLTGDAFSTAPVIDPGTGFRTVTLKAPFDFSVGTGIFAGAMGKGFLVLTSLRATDTSPTATFTSTGTVVLDGPGLVATPEPVSFVLLGSGLIACWSRRRNRA